MSYHYFYRPPKPPPANQARYRNCDPETYFLIGSDMGEVMKKLAAVKPPPKKVAR